MGADTKRFTLPQRGQVYRPFSINTMNSPNNTIATVRP
jgi:hypothetical protein